MHYEVENVGDVTAESVQVVGEVTRQGESVKKLASSLTGSSDADGVVIMPPGWCGGKAFELARCEHVERGVPASPISAAAPRWPRAVGDDRVANVLRLDAEQAERRQHIGDVLELGASLGVREGALLCLSWCGDGEQAPMASTIGESKVSVCLRGDERTR